MQLQPDRVKDEMQVFIGANPSFREAADYLPEQRGKAINAENLELKEHQKQALAALEEMRSRNETSSTKRITLLRKPIKRCWRTSSRNSLWG